MRNAPGVPSIDYAPGDFDPWETFVRLGPDMIDIARDMREYANHHSGVDVGAVVLASSEDGMWGLFPAANQNLRKGPNDTKACAEEIAITKVLEHGFRRIHAIVGVGTVQADSESGLVTDTLHNCRMERGHFVPLWGKGILKRHTKVVTAHPDKDVFEIYSQSDLAGIHRNRATDRLESHSDPGFRIWRAGLEAYRQRVAADVKAGRRPDRPRLAHEAAIGHLAIAS